ncbi:nucleoside deaminase [Actinotalea sp. M2MS4P-6]|uniref:nucleoside deaminase n=1 Tax=Actinotalea sp. M2MS4P-6 TaxID=2983762 RepID=UPI0021E376AB|nr:nucleoside deaminase [Actinotalea sp. M2MS4P-6]MCV2393655.1 nucleoside deaminase [Actinotalea sp. M2MS4P-6]
MSSTSSPDVNAASPAEEIARLQAAIDLAVRNVADGGGPFGAVIVHDGAVVGTGQNRVTRDNDPTAHAEVMAIRAACRRLGSFSLAGSVLYSSCEPCPLCLAAALWARIDRVVFAADRDDAARAGFDDRAFYELQGQDPAAWPMPVVQRRVHGSADPMDAWLAFEGRVAY